MLKILYTVFGVGVISLYTVGAMLGWEMGHLHDASCRPMRDKMVTGFSISGITATRRKMMLIHSIGLYVPTCAD